MTQTTGTTGLIFNEPLLWETGAAGRSAYSLPENDTGTYHIDPGLVGDTPDFPELSEFDVVRHYTRLSQWNFGVDSGMYPLGSCTMKYNPKTNERQAALPGFVNAHPMTPPRLLQGAFRLMYDLERFIGAVTGMDAVSLQPAAGAQGELTGIMVIHAYFRSRGEHRTKVLVPDTAHGTNPASIALCGMTPVAVKSDERGVVSPAAVEAAMDDDVAGIMLTNPNTLGLYEEHIHEIAGIVHGRGGLVYCDGANLNAIMGIVQLGKIGADVMHVNLHKTFSSPHGGGGPGCGPVCVREHLAPFLPSPRVVKTDDGYTLCDDYPDSVGRVHAFFGNVGVMIRAYSYILSMGAEHLKNASRYAVLSANYIRAGLKDVFDLPYDRPCMHECVFSDATQQVHKVSTLDMAKRLIDYGFHPPTVYFPLVVKGAIMIEPTESESKETLDAFIETMRAIAEEAVTSPDIFHDAPRKSKVGRLDEVKAARELKLEG